MDKINKLEKEIEALKSNINAIRQCCGPNDFWAFKEDWERFHRQIEIKERLIEEIIKNLGKQIAQQEAKPK